MYVFMYVFQASTYFVKSFIVLFLPYRLQGFAVGFAVQSKLAGIRMGDDFDNPVLAVCDT